MNLDDTQKAKVAAWISEGLKLSDIQTRLESELGLRLTYMEVRFLVDDLKLTPKDVERTKPADLAVPAPAAPAGRKPAPAGGSPAAEPAAAKAGAVSVTVDQLARPGAMVSGKVTFSDGNKGEWYFDQTGRLAVAMQQQGYRPSPADVQQFQALLDQELSRIGF